ERFFFSSRRRHTSWPRDWSSDVCSSDLGVLDYRHWVQIGHARGELHVLADRRRGVRVFSFASRRIVERPMFHFALSTLHHDAARSEERRVGKEWRSRSAPCPVLSSTQTC